MAVPSGATLWDLVDRDGTVVMTNLSTATVDILKRIETLLNPSTIRASSLPIDFASRA